MQQYRHQTKPCTAVGSDVAPCCRSFSRYPQLRSPQRLIASNANVEARVLDARPASSADVEAASFSGRGLPPQHNGSRPRGSSDPPLLTQPASHAGESHTATRGVEFSNPLPGAPRLTLRATLAAAASACVLHGSLAPWLLLRATTDGPPDQRGAAQLAAVLRGAPAFAAETPHDRMDKLDAVRQLATPDVKAMRELWEELAAKPPPAAATTTPAAVAGPADAAAVQSTAARAQADPNARIKAEDLASLLHISASQAKSILSSERDLGRLTRGSVSASFDVARELMGLGGDGRHQLEQAGRLVVRQPRVLLISAPELRGRFAELQSLLAAPIPLARQLVSLQPGLLTHPPAILRARLSSLCPLFNVDPSLAAELAKHEPGLLAANAAELQQRSSQLAEELKFSKPQLVAVLRRYPQALLVASDAMRSRLRSLSELLEVPRGEVLGTVVLNSPRLLVLREGEAAGNLRQLERLLQVSRDRATAIAAEIPPLLSTPGPVLEERLRTLAELAKVPLAQARSLVEQKPSLLTKSSHAMRRAVAVAEAAEARQAQAQGGGPQGGSR